MSNSIIYAKNSTRTGEIDETKMIAEIAAVPEITTGLVTIVDAGDEFALVFLDTPTAEELTHINAVVYAHSHLSAQESVRLTMQRAVEFGNNLMIEFAAENILLGITQAGKTKQVADYLQNVMRYIQSGSLYEVISEIDSLISAGIAPELAPFVTEARLLAFRGKVTAYLGMP